MKRLFTLLSSFLLTSAAFAQIPNASFENWTTTGSYHDATGWGDLNSTTAAIMLYTCDSSQMGVPTGGGSAYMKLTAKLPPIGSTAIPGVAVTGVINLNLAAGTYSATGGFPNTTRQANFTGSFKYMGMSGDRPRMGAVLWKWNATAHTRDTVAKIDTIMVTDMIMDWTTFSFPFKYLHGETPDSGFIALSTSATSPQANSYLYVDNLAFSGTVPNGVVSIPNITSSVVVYPNPASGATSIYYHSNAGGNVSVSLTDMAGKTITSFNTKTITGENDIPLSLKNMAQGLYIVKLADETGTVEKKLLVQ